MAHDLSVVLAALADPTRRAVLELVARAPRRASDLAEAVGASRPGMSRHLRVLREAGLLRADADEEDGRVANLRIDRAPLAAVTSFLSKLAPSKATRGGSTPRAIDWSEQLASFKVVAEDRARGARAARSARRRAG